MYLAGSPHAVYEGMLGRVHGVQEVLLLAHKANLDVPDTVDIGTERLKFSLVAIESIAAISVRMVFWVVAFVLRPCLRVVPSFQCVSYVLCGRLALMMVVLEDSNFISALEIRCRP